MRPLTVRELVAHPTFGLRLIAGRRRASTLIKSAHTSDLDRPGRYVLPGELILTNGLWLGLVSSEQWVDEVRSAGACASGVGLSGDHRRVPEELVRLCDALQMPLLTVPEELSFAVISEYIHTRSSGGEASTLRQQLLRTRRMFLRATDDGGYADLLELLGRETGLAGAFVGHGGSILATSVRGWPKRAAAEQAAEAALRGALPSAIGPDLSAFGPSTRRPISTLIVRSSFADIGDDLRLLVEQITAFAAFEDARQQAQEEVGCARAEELIRLVRAAEIGDVSFAERVRAMQLDPALALVPVATDIPRDALRHAGEVCNLRYVVAELDQSRLMLIEEPGPRVLEEIAEAIGKVGIEAVLGCGRPAAGVESLRRSLAEAEVGLQIARSQPPGERLARGAEVGSHALLLRLLEPATATSYREAVLGPIEEWDQAHSSELLTTVRTFLELDGHWRETAKRLHIHQNTLRYRLARVETITGRSLAATADRVDFFLALTLAAGDARTRTNR
jgi:hypothetical protein